MIYRPLAEYEMQRVEFDIIAGNPIESSLVERILLSVDQQISEHKDDIDQQCNELESRVDELEDQAEIDEAKIDRLEDEIQTLKDRIAEYEVDSR